MKTLPFGIHKDKPVESVPLHYLKWLLTLPDLFPETRQLVQKELDRRVIERVDREFEREHGKLKPVKPADQRLLKKDWKYSRQGRYSCWVARKEKSRGWCCYMVPLAVAQAVQACLDALKAKRRVA